MKAVLLVLSFLVTFSATAQNLGKRYEFINTVADKIPVHGSKPFYDSLLKLGDEFPMEKLEANMAYYYANIFGSDLVQKNGKHATTAAGTYTFNTTNRQTEEDNYVVNYWMDISVKNGRCTIEMHDFTIVHKGYELDIAKKLDAARNGDGVARQVLAIFHGTNMDVMHKASKVMSAKSMDQFATVSN